MSKNSLNVVEVSNPADDQDNPLKKGHPKQKLSKREEARNKFERLWLHNPEQFNPMRNAMERERITRTLQLLEEFLIPKGKKIADLGCGSGALAAILADKGVHIDAIDIASNALKKLNEKKLPNVNASQDYVPQTLLQDDAYDLVLCTDLIAYLDPVDYRLFFSELARLVKPEGYILCSTPIDIYSDDALQKFATMAETEIVIEKWVLSYNALYIRFLNVLKIFEQSPRILYWFENVCKFIWSDSGISHAIFIGKRKPLIKVPEEEKLPQERKHRKEVWE